MRHAAAFRPRPFGAGALTFLSSLHAGAIISTNALMVFLCSTSHGRARLASALRYSPRQRHCCRLCQPRFQRASCPAAKPLRASDGIRFHAGERDRRLGRSSLNSGSTFSRRRLSHHHRPRHTYLFGILALHAILVTFKAQRRIGYDAAAGSKRFGHHYRYATDAATTI